MKNRLYFHVYSCNDYVNVIMAEMLNRIEAFGLAENCDCLNFCILGDKKFLNVDFPKNSKIHVNKNLYEFDTIRLLWEECQEEDMNVCYVHTKGVTKPGWINVDDWRKYMSYFIIDKWENRVSELAEYDCTGVNFSHSPSRHYSGNFWWSKSSYIKKNKDIMERYPDRMFCEMWLCQPEESKYNSVWNSPINHYIERYTEENYIERK